ncbi:DNA-protecting protein DprA [Alicyclobacillaceae bacterium I2511]|nr:DNA-protecting protein DprA [Alicyclobacillaceae bacterium I2511]
MKTQRMYTVALATCPVLEPRTLRRLIDSSGDAQNVWQGTSQDWLTRVRLQPRTVGALERYCHHTDPRSVEASLNRRNVHCIVQGDEAYPQSLLALPEPPLVLFVRGNLHLLDTEKIWVAIVGTRRASGYAREAATWIGQTLAGNGVAVVSGLAEGVDGAAHRGALQTDTGYTGVTVAVLGNGIDLCYPAFHQDLYDKIALQGMLMSEYGPGVSPARYRFPERNRIITGLAQTLIVVQAGEKSGALISADLALDLGKDVYVVPGPITSRHYRGSNNLLRQGAQVLLDPMDFLRDIGLTPTTPTAFVAENFVPKRWLELYQLMNEPMSAGALALSLQMPFAQVYAGLLELELAGCVVRQSGGLYMQRPRLEGEQLTRDGV